MHQVSLKRQKNHVNQNQEKMCLPADMFIFVYSGQ